MFRIAACCGLIVFGLASALRAGEKGPGVLAETTRDGLTVAIITPHPSKEKADGHLCALLRFSPSNGQINLPLYDLVVSAVTDRGETLRPPPHFRVNSVRGDAYSNSCNVTLLPPAEPAETLSRLTVTLPKVPFVSEWRTVAVDLAEDGEPPANLPDIPGLTGVTRNPRNLGRYVITFSPDWLPDSDRPDVVWSNIVRAEYALEDGTVRRMSGSCSQSSHVVDDVRIYGDMEYSLFLPDDETPVRLILHVPSAGKLRDVVAEFKDIPIRALLCGTTDEDESEHQEEESE